MKENRDKNKVIITGALILVSQLVQYNTVYKHLTNIGLWPPSLLSASILFIFVIALNMLSAWLGGWAELKGKSVFFVLWITCFLLSFPWFGFLLSAIIDHLFEN